MSSPSKSRLIDKPEIIFSLFSFLHGFPSIDIGAVIQTMAIGSSYLAEEEQTMHWLMRNDYVKSFVSINIL